MIAIVEAIPRRRNTWIELVAGNGERAKLPASEVHAGVSAGARLEPEEWSALLDRAAYCQAFETCVRILARREHFPLELRNKLKARGVDRRHIRQALDACRERGYLDERRAAEQLVDNLAARGGIGFAKYKAMLAQRGCPKELSAEILAARLADLDEGAEARLLLERRNRSFAAKLDSMTAKAGAATLQDPKMRVQVYRRLGAAVMRHLASRGLTSRGARHAAAEFTQSLMDDA